MICMSVRGLNGQYIRVSNVCVFKLHAFSEGGGTREGEREKRKQILQSSSIQEILDFPKFHNS